jgi:hypothetical protein
MACAARTSVLRPRRRASGLPRYRLAVLLHITLRRPETCAPDRARNPEQPFYVVPLGRIAHWIAQAIPAVPQTRDDSSPHLFVHVPPKVCQRIVIDQVENNIVIDVPNDLVTTEDALRTSLQHLDVSCLRARRDQRLRVGRQPT